jgi:hypothetical protein
VCVSVRKCVFVIVCVRERVGVIVNVYVLLSECSCVLMCVCVCVLMCVCVFVLMCVCV